MKVMTIAQMILRTAVVLALILGIIFWINPGFPQQYAGVKYIHMALGIIVVLALWLIGLMLGRVKNGSFGLAVGTFVIGLLVLIVGGGQEGWKDATTSTAVVQLINVIHLLLGLTAVGFAEMVVGRARRQARAAA